MRGAARPAENSRLAEHRVRLARFSRGLLGKNRQVAVQRHPGQELGRIKQRYPPVPDRRHQFGVAAHGLLEGELFLVIQEEDNPPVQFGEFDEQSQTELHHIFHEKQRHGRGAGLLEAFEMVDFLPQLQVQGVNLIELIFQQLFVLLQFLDGGLEQRPGHQQAQPGFPEGKPFFPFQVVFAILIAFEETPGFLHLGRRQVPDPENAGVDALVEPAEIYDAGNVGEPMQPDDRPVPGES